MIRKLTLGLALALLVTTNAHALTRIPGGMQYQQDGTQIAVLLDTPIRTDRQMLETFSLAIRGVYRKNETITRKSVDIAYRNGKTGMVFDNGREKFFFLPFKNETGAMYAFGMFRE